jgi:NAD(P)H-dependent flavin oxidoreductase YrpB (nitropropane dioxygenase family)
MKYPKVIQGGMGVGVSDWKLARAVSLEGQLGVVSGTAVDQIFIRRLQIGDPDGLLQNALSHFPDQGMARKILDTYFIPRGKPENQPFKTTPMLTIKPSQTKIELIVIANFVEIFLAKQGHKGIVGINLLEKIQLPNLFSLYGAMLAGVDYVIMGAGIPVEIPGILDKFSDHKEASLKISVEGAAIRDNYRLTFAPGDFFSKKMPPLKRPEFFCIVSSDVLAKMMYRKASGKVNGFVVEGPAAGGHNAPPRGKLELNPSNEPVYHKRDMADLEKIKEFGLPFWLAGSFGSPEKLKQALAIGARGIQVGTLFAFSRESGFSLDLKKEVKKCVLQKNARVFTDPQASPTGFPFKVLSLKGSLSDEKEYEKRIRVCDLGYLRHMYKKPDGSVGYQCPAEPEKTYIQKGGKPEDTRNRKCLCNALLSNIGLSQLLENKDDMEKTLVTVGDNISSIANFISSENDTYTATDVLKYLLQES